MMKCYKQNQTNSLDHTDFGSNETNMKIYTIDSLNL